MKCIITDEVVLSRAPEGPLAVHIGPFAQSRSVQGYARSSIHRQVLLAAGLSQWLQQQRVALRHVTTEHLSQYLRYRARRVRVCEGDAAALRHLLDFLCREGVIPAEKNAALRPTAAEGCAREYAQYLRDARALARATIVNYVSFIRGFLTDRFAAGPVRLARLSASDVVRFVQQQAPQLHLKRAKLLPHCLTFLSAVRALSRRGGSRFGCRRAHRGELVDIIDPSCNWGEPGPSVAGQHRSAYRDRPSRLRDRAPAGTTGVAFRRSGFS